MTWHGMKRAEMDARLDEIVSFAEVGDFLDTPLKRFSSGMYVRLAFSIAVNMRPAILLADEILAVGDLAFQERCLQRVREAGAAGMTVLFVSHDMAAIQRLCDRVLWLNAGGVAMDGDPEQVVAAYEQAAWTVSSAGAKAGRKHGDHVNEHGEILSVRLLSADGRELGAVRTDEEVDLTVTFSLLTPGSAARCVMALLTRGTVAFRTAQPEDIVVTQPGIFAAAIRIPAHLLADTSYTLKVGILIVHQGRQHTLVLDNALVFRVYAGDDPNRRDLLAKDVYRGAAWSGAVMPRLDWRVTRERDVVTVPA
jgi:hypothetical protein